MRLEGPVSRYELTSALWVAILDRVCPKPLVARFAIDAVSVLKQIRYGWVADILMGFALSARAVFVSNFPLLSGRLSLDCHPKTALLNHAKNTHDDGSRTKVSSLMSFPLFFVFQPIGIMPLIAAHAEC